VARARDRCPAASGPVIFNSRRYTGRGYERTVEKPGNGEFYLQCPYCGKVHAGDLAMNRVTAPLNGILSTLATLPCKNKIVLFFSTNRQYRGFQKIDEINVIDFKNDVLKIPGNYNDEYNRFAAEHGLQSKFKT
jgi:hypothetical protein